jgi:hypothetical protein
MGIALAFAHGHGTRLRAWALHGPGEGLPLPLKMALFGLDPRSEADRAIRHLVDSARRGAHVAVRVISDDDAVAVQAKLLSTLSDGALLIVARVRAGAPLELDRIAPLLAAHPGPLIALDVPRTPAPTEILAILPGPQTPGFALAARQADALDRLYPTFRPRGIDRLDSLEVVAKDCTPEVLTLIGLPSARSLGPLKGLGGPLETLSPGPVAVIIPPGPEASGTLGRLMGQ